MPRHDRGRDYFYEDDVYDYESDGGARRERVFEEDVDYRRRAPPVREAERVRVRDRPAPDFIRDSFAPRRDSGQLVVRPERDGEFDIPVRSRREVEVERDDDVCVRREPSRGRPVKEVEREEIVLTDTEKNNRGHRNRDVGRDDVILKERDDVYARRAPSPGRRAPMRDVKEREELVVEDRDRGGRSYVDQGGERGEVIVRRRERSLPARGYERNERPRGRPLSEYQRDDYDFRFEGRDGAARDDYESERVEVRCDRGGRTRSRPLRRIDDDEEIIIRKQDRDHGSRRAPRESEEEEIIFRRGERGQGRKKFGREDEEQEEEIIVRRGERGRSSIRPREGGKEEEIIIQNTQERSPSPQPQPPEDPYVIKAPPIHQEVITHHRHVDHGYETIRPPRTPSPKPRPTSIETLEIQNREKGDRSSYEDIVIERKGKRESPSSVRWTPSSHSESRSEEIIMPRGRPKSPEREREVVVTERARENIVDRRDERGIQEEADFYERRIAKHPSFGEANQGVTKDWTMIDVPPGTKRVTMEGVGGANEQVSWQRYNGVRRARLLPNGEALSDDELHIDRGQVSRRYYGAKDRKDRLWTEITKDLVLKEAIERSGYEYEETEYFYYVFSYLRYEDVAALVDLSDEIRRARRERIHEIHRERLSLPPAPLRPLRRSGDESKYKEEVIVEGGRRPPRRW